MDAEMRTLQTYWWALTLRGVIAILFGIAAVFWPGITLVTLVYIFSTWVLVDGVIRIVSGVSRIGGGQLGLLTMLVGLLELGVGVYLLRHPLVSFATLILLIGFMLIVGGVVEIVAALSERKEGATSKTLAVVVGVVTALAGIIMLFQPASAGVAFVWILGLFALITGPLMIAMSLELRNYTDKVAAKAK